MGAPQSSLRSMSPRRRGAGPVKHHPSILRATRGHAYAGTTEPVSGLLQFHQGAAEVLGVQEQDRFPMRPHLGLAVAQGARAGGLEGVAGGNDVVDLVANVMNATVGVAFEKFD